MKVYQDNEGDSKSYLLSKRRQFKTIVELVSFYERNDLGENFAGYLSFFLLIVKKFLISKYFVLD